MTPNLPKLLTFLTFISFQQIHAQEIWHESFLIPEKGVWGNNDSDTILTDFEGIANWSLDYSKALLMNADDYAKTVSTSGGRFECCDINAEVIWYAEEIDISEFKNISIQLIAAETGSGANENTKYLKAYYKTDNDEPQLFGEKYGNWDSDSLIISGLNGDKLQVQIVIRNDYASDKVYFNEVSVLGEEKNPVIIEPGNVLINEVLFNPVPGGEDFVEIYNNSEKQIPLNKLFLASRDKELELTQVYILTTDKENLRPREYLVLTIEIAGVFPWFTIECPACFLQMEKFPSYNNDEDNVVLLNNEMEVIDELVYSEKMHLPVFQDREGVSLERITFSAPTNDWNNWHSASSISGFGTPGYINSQAADELPEKSVVQFAPDAFSPNNDGYNDVYTISIQTDHPGYLCTVSIFYPNGQRIMNLKKNTLLGTSNEITWDGRNESGQRLQLGAYIVLVELYDLQGKLKHMKDAVILTDVLE